MAGLTPSSIAWQIALSAAVAAFGMFAYKLIKIRMIYYKLKKQGMPMPVWNFALGNILTLPSLMQKFPQDALQADIFTQLSFDFKESDNCFYMDIWPFTSPLFIVTSPEMAIQACQEYDLPKPDILTPFFLPFSGGPNLFDTNGTEWKRSRALFNSAFSANAILENTPRILPEAEAYVAQLRKHAEKGDTFSLDVLTCDYIMDIIGVITLDDRFLSMTQHNDLAAAMRSSIEWHCGDQELNPFKRWNPMRPYIHWRNGKIMDRYIDRELDKRYEVWKSNKPSTKAKSIMDITIAAYMSERKFADKLDAKFKKWATIQIRAFLFAGHDSTAATIVYSLYLLSKYPEAAAKVRAELDEVFGEGTDSAARVLKDRPQEINRLTYITAVIKETLRVFPPAAGMRGGLPGVFLRDKNGNKYPTEDINVWIIHGAIQRHPDYWPEPQKFIPERWLVEPGHPLYPPKGAWRPFEFGPRNCIGQTLVMLDVKITLAMIVREFDIHDQYEEWDRLHPSSGVKTVFGERAYQVPLGAAHPVHGFPCKVTFRGAK